MAIFNVDVTSVVELGRDPDGHLSVTSVSCEAHIEDVDLQIQGGSRYFIQEEKKDKWCDTDAHPTKFCFSICQQLAHPTHCGPFQESHQR